MISECHSSGTMFAHGLLQPTRTASLTSPCGVIAFREQPALPSLFGFAPGVVCHAVSVAGPAVRSYRTFSPLLPPPFIPPPHAGGGRGRGRRFLSVALSLGPPPPALFPQPVCVDPRTC